MSNVLATMAIAALFLLGGAIADPAASCGKDCAAEKATAAAVKKPALKKSRRGYGETVNAAGGNIDEYWSPCNSKYWPDYMYCQP